MKGYMTYGRAEGKFGGESPCLPGVRHVDKLDKKLKKGKTQKGKCKKKTPMGVTKLGSQCRGQRDIARKREDYSRTKECLVCRATRWPGQSSQC